LIDVVIWVWEVVINAYKAASAWVGRSHDKTTNRSKLV